MKRDGSEASITPRTEYVHARVRCPRCGASVRAEGDGSAADRCANCRTAR